MQILKKNWFKTVVIFCVCLLVRLIPFRPPNIEPILTAQMPFSKAYGSWIGFAFAFMSIVLFDLATGKTGVWTLITALSYGCIGLWAGRYFKNRSNEATTYASFAVMSTIGYDVVTGLTIGPIFFNQTLVQAFVGQIPFTVIHLIGNVAFAVILSPALYTYILYNNQLEPKTLLEIFNPKTI